MKIAIQTWGSTGDIHPFVALAAGLAQQGHEVTLIITTMDRRDFASVGAQYGFRVVRAGLIGYDISEMNEIGKRIFAIRNPLKQLGRVYHDLFTPCAEEMYAAAQEHFAQHDLVIAHFIHHVAHLAAEQAGKPYITVMLNHGMVHSQLIPPSPLPNLGRWLNTFTWRMLDGMLDRIVLPVINDFRARQGGQPLAATQQVWESKRCNLIAVSPALCRPQPDWGSHHKLCGFIHLPHIAAETQLPQHVRDFLEAGPPPVFFTFGSMMGLPEPSEELEQTIRLWEAAAQLARCRAIMQTHWHMARYQPQSPDILCIEYTDHTLLFKHCAAVVHHGGSGTTQSALLGGCPSVVVAHLVDQHLFAEELHRIGVAAKPLTRPAANARRLAKRIRLVLDSPEMKRKAAEIGASMHQDNGLEVALEFLQQEMERL